MCVTGFKRRSCFAQHLSLHAATEHFRSFRLDCLHALCYELGGRLVDKLAVGKALRKARPVSLDWILHF